MTINVKNLIKKTPKPGVKNVIISMRVTTHIKKWLKEKNYTPSALFYEALKEIGYKEEKNERKN